MWSPVRKALFSRIRHPNQIISCSYRVTGVAERIQSRILSSKEARTRHNEVDKGPDPRGRKRVITGSETAAIADYLDDSDVPLDDKGKPWLNIAQEADIILP